MKTNYLFVYGTLLKDSKHEMALFLEKHAELVGKGSFNGKLFKVSWFPGAIKSKDSSEKVYGSVFKIHDFETIIPALDDYEGYGDNFSEPFLYIRDIVSVSVDGKIVKAWIYLYNQPIDGLQQILSGDFLKT